MIGRLNIENPEMRKLNKEKSEVRKFNTENP